MTAILKTKVLSWDVGIKNLAYCLMEINKESSDFKILNWDVICLADDNKLCNYVGKKKQCEKQATSCITLNNDTKLYYCGGHVTSQEFNTNNIDVKVNIISDTHDGCNVTCDACKNTAKKLYTANVFDGVYCKCDMYEKLKCGGYICAYKKCNKNITVRLDNTGSNVIGWCDEHNKVGCDEYIKKNTKTISKNCNKLPLDNLGMTMFRKLDALPYLLTVDRVLIENQPTFINPTMKTISALLYGYFVMRGMHEKSKTNSTINSVVFCSPSRKLKVCNTSDTTLKNTEKNKVYKMTKKLSVEYTKALLDDKDTLSIMLAHKKKDDMCDAFLQGFMMSFGSIPERYYGKLQSFIDDP